MRECFNPRAREERDSIYAGDVAGACRFNPRAREERDTATGAQRRNA